MDNCKHIGKLSPASDHSVLNPQRWKCDVCGTTESVWACLSCPYVACGRFIAEHALRHYKETKHSLALEVNEKYLYCYDCDEYVLNDNAAGDVKMLRSCLGAVATQSFRDIPRKHHRLLRSHSFSPQIGTRVEDQRLREEDACFTALWFRRYYTMAKVFNCWKKCTRSLAAKMEAAEAARLRELKQLASTANSVQCPPPTHQEPAPTPTPTPAATRSSKRTLQAGVTGLRNLGNTCYMNSILQVLSNVQEFREAFMKMQNMTSPEASASPPATAGSSKVPLPTATTSGAAAAVKGRTRVQRQTTMECYKYVSDGPSSYTPRSGGLNGGSTSYGAMGGLGALGGLGGLLPAHVKSHLSRPKHSDKSKVSLCGELHALLRVMWSGKWALVSPHKMLQSVWTAIPFFRGYTQQDAQEFLNEFLAKVQQELDIRPSSPTSSQGGATFRSPGGDVSGRSNDVVDNLFQGELVSEVKCSVCGHKSRTLEPFMDLSLDFPSRYHWHQTKYGVCTDDCHLQEMLDKFTEVEQLDGAIYACEQCNNRRRRRKTAAPLYTRAEKRFMIHKLPHVLRLHLKRFTWSGRNHRGKIPVHVDFDEVLDLADLRPPEVKVTDSALYRLAAVVMHHGRGFGSGHYTSYCWNTHVGSWVHCNDSTLTLCRWEDVSLSQAYILVYVRQDDPGSEIRDLDPSSAAFTSRDKFEEEADNEITFNYRKSSIPKFVELKRKLAEDARGRMELKRQKTTLW